MRTLSSGALALASSNDPPTIAQAIEDYIEWSIGQGHSPSTIKNKQKTLTRKFQPWCEERGVTYVEDVTRKVVEAFQAHLMTCQRQGRGRTDGKLSRTTVNHSLRAVAAMLAWARERDEEGRLPTFKVHPVRVGKKVVQILTEAELRKLQAVACRNERDFLMVWLLINTGMRAGELILITESDLFDEKVRGEIHRYIRIHGKGSGGHGDERAVPILDAEIYRRLKRLAQNESIRVGESGGHIFWTYRHPFRPLGYNGLYNIITGLGVVARLGRNLHPHLFRHTYITSLERQGYQRPQISTVVGNYTSLDTYSWLDHRDAWDIAKSAR